MNEDFDHDSFLLVSILPHIVETCGFQELEHSPLVITSVHHGWSPQVKIGRSKQTLILFSHT
jgi:hypothetical protein